MLRRRSTRVLLLAVVLLTGCGGGAKTATSTGTGSTRAPVGTRALAACLKNAGYHVNDLGPRTGPGSRNHVDGLSLYKSTTAANSRSDAQVYVYRNPRDADTARIGHISSKEDVLPRPSVGQIGDVVYVIDRDTAKIARDIRSCAA
jgi:hypothetical protein